MRDFADQQQIPWFLVRLTRLVTDSPDRLWAGVWILGVGALWAWDAAFLNRPAYLRLQAAFVNTMAGATLTVLFTLILGSAYTLPFFGGFIMGYILYDEVHYATHHAPMKFGFWQKMKHHHVLHHYHDPGRGYGVSSPLWDYVFGTMDPTEEKSPVEARQ